MRHQLADLDWIRPRSHKNTVLRIRILVFWLKNFFYLFNNKIIYNFIIFVASINGRTTKIVSVSSLGAVVGSEIRDPEWINQDPG